MASSNAFYRTELERALRENDFAIKSSELLSTSNETNRATAKLTLLEGEEVLVELINDGFRIKGEAQIFDTLDSLLLNRSPKSMEMVSQVLSSKLEQLITQETDEEEQTPATQSEIPAESSTASSKVDVGEDGGKRGIQASAPVPSSHDPLSSELQPVTNATLTIRCIKSFEYRTERNLVLKGLDLTKLTAGQVIERCREAVRTTPGWKPYKTVKFDTLKLYNQAHSHKTMNLIINLDNDEWILDDMDKTMADYGALNETEYSLFNREAYDTFKANPTIRWD